MDATTKPTTTTTPSPSPLTSNANQTSSNNSPNGAASLGGGTSVSVAAPPPPTATLGGQGVIAGGKGGPLPPPSAPPGLILLEPPPLLSERFRRSNVRLIRRRQLQRQKRLAAASGGADATGTTGEGAGGGSSSLSSSSYGKATNTAQGFSFSSSMNAGFERNRQNSVMSHGSAADVAGVGAGGSGVGAAAGLKTLPKISERGGAGNRHRKHRGPRTIGFVPTVQRPARILPDQQQDHHHHRLGKDETGIGGDGPESEEVRPDKEVAMSPVASAQHRLSLSMSQDRRASQIKRTSIAHAPHPTTGGTRPNNGRLSTVSFSASAAGTGGAHPTTAASVSGAGGGGPTSSTNKVPKDTDDSLKTAGGGDGEDIKYAPFPLSTHSSFNGARLSKRQLVSMHPVMRAKYGAYEMPPARVIEQIEGSHKRSRAVMRFETKALKTLVEEYQRRQRIWRDTMKVGASTGAASAGVAGRTSRVIREEERGYEGVQEEVRVAEEGSRRAKERMKEKIRQAMMDRDMELQYLVEGQRNSIDAIRLKEFIALRPLNIDLKTKYTERDRLRVEELLSTNLN
ncbi:hypothetical protein HK102_002716 [Quaeritorhiza haematococci]|nr:hypothetical protein HK102_002716 [Quaeritorhiza haematococci]